MEPNPAKVKLPLLYLKVEEVARLLSLSRAKTYEMVMRGEIPSLTFGRSRRVSYEELLRWRDLRDAEAVRDGRV
jgi:excisionase family DNA binding protein